MSCAFAKTRRKCPTKTARQPKRLAARMFLGPGHERIKNLLLHDYKTICIQRFRSPRIGDSSHRCLKITFQTPRLKPGTYSEVHDTMWSDLLFPKKIHASNAWAPCYHRKEGNTPAFEIVHRETRQYIIAAAVPLG